MKIRVECKATVVVDIDVTKEQLKKIDDGTLALSDVVDETVPYAALRDDGEFEFELFDAPDLRRRGAK